MNEERQTNVEKCKREFLMLNPVFIEDIFVNPIWGMGCSVCTVELQNEGDFIVAEDYYRATSPSWCDMERFVKPWRFPANVIIVANENSVAIARDPLAIYYVAIVSDPSSAYVKKVKQMLCETQEQKEV